jgi:hypothetical protein
MIGRSSLISVIIAALLWAAPAEAAEVESSVIVTMGAAYKTTVDRWTRAVATSGLETTAYIFPWIKDPLHSNGHADTILMIPDSAVPDQITLVLWFHGLGGFSERTFRDRIMPQVKSLSQEDGHSLAIAVVEMPWSTNTRTPRKRQGKIFRTPGQLTGLVDELMDRLSAHFHGRGESRLMSAPRIAVVGHSAGGSALMSASESGDLCEIGPAHVVWSDASYGPWLKRAWSGCLRQAQGVRTEVLVRKGDIPWKRALQHVRRVGSPPNFHLDILPRKEWSHRRIGDSVLWLSNIFVPGC